MSDEFLERAIGLITAAISDRDVIGQCPSEEWRDYLAVHLLDCFVNFLNLKGKELQYVAFTALILADKPLPAVVFPVLDGALLQRLLEILQSARLTETPNAILVINHSFNAILDACIYRSELWTTFESTLLNSGLLREILLDDPRAPVRKSVMKQIMKKCAFSPRHAPDTVLLDTRLTFSSSAQVTSSDFANSFWPMLVALIPDAAKHSATCEETFMLALQVFRKKTEVSPESLDVMPLIEQWSELLLSHVPDEVCTRLPTHFRILTFQRPLATLNR